MNKLSNLLLMDDFPFRTVISFENLIAFFESEAGCENPEKVFFARKILDKINDAPELRKPIDDLNIIEKNKHLVDLMMSAIFPGAVKDKIIAACMAPFRFNFIYATRKFRELLGTERGGIMPDIHIDVESASFNKLIHAYFQILREFYNVNIDYFKSISVSLQDPESGFVRYFSLLADTQFTKPRALGEIPSLTQEQINELLDDVTNLKRFNELIPPDKFEFVGFNILNVIDITEQEILSQLKYDLLEREAIISYEKFKLLETRLRSYFKMKNISLGLAAFPSDPNLNFEFGQKLGESFALNDSCKMTCSNFAGSVYEKAINLQKPLVIDNIEKLKDKTEIEKQILAQGIKNILIAPLYHSDELIGVLELGSPVPCQLTSLSLVKIQEVLALFTIAVKRSLDELENNIQAIIKEECTAIHPSVEWRFRKAAANKLMRQDSSGNTRMEPIYFEKVYPLFGISDIRNSSEFRNLSIQQDLSEQLYLSRQVVHTAALILKLPYLEELVFRIDKFIQNITSGLNSGDEIDCIEFIRNEVEPLFDHLAEENKKISKLVEKYRNSLDPELGIIYRKRKDYEESVSILNRNISAYLDKLETEAQKMFPHYFEKYKTDGVEHGMYIGASLTEEKKYHPVYLKNLRLWQLITVCRIAQSTTRLMHELKIPLETTHLILVHNSPLTIKFRYDEKKFDVEGSYNLRYEIMKKRIDKALIRGTKERLTQPGKVAIVYSQDSEAEEYRRYIEFLVSKKLIGHNTESFELENLQGIQGLKALRITVNPDSEKIYSIPDDEMIQKFTINASMTSN